MKTSGVALSCAMFLALLVGMSRAADLGVSEKKIEGEGYQTVFTFRNGKLLHEVTTFSEKPPKRALWVERFYADGQLTFLRAGADHLISAHYSGPLRVRIVNAGRRLYIGREAYNLTEDGVYRLIVDPRSTLGESIINDPVFSSRKLDQERQKYLHPATLQE